MTRHDVLEAIRRLRPEGAPRTTAGNVAGAAPALPHAITLADLVRALGLAEQLAFDRETAAMAPPPEACARARASTPCSAVLFTITCRHCGKTYRRCELHGAEKGARASLKSHRGLMHSAVD